MSIDFKTTVKGFEIVPQKLYGVVDRLKGHRPCIKGIYNAYDHRGNPYAKGVRISLAKGKTLELLVKLESASSDSNPVSATGRWWSYYEVPLLYEQRNKVAVPFEKLAKDFANFKELCELIHKTYNFHQKPFLYNSQTEQGYHAVMAEVTLCQKPVFFIGQAYDLRHNRGDCSWTIY